MVFTLVVYGAPYSSESPLTAYNFARATLAKGHNICRIFFFHDGALNGSGAVSSHNGEFSLLSGWQDLHKRFNIDMVICIGSGTKRGVINEQEAKRAGIACGTLAPGFELSGLGQLVEAMIKSDRIITFGSAT